MEKMPQDDDFEKLLSEHVEADGLIAVEPQRTKGE